MEKIYDKIIWHNNNEPALNEDNLNAMSEAIDGIDDRVIALGDDVFVIVPQIQAYLAQADDLVQALETMTQNPPYIGDNGNWYTWDTDTMQYVDSGVDASISVEIADITMLSPGADPYVTNTGTDTDPIFHLFIPRGDDGVSPEVTITAITGGHRITITDADHPSGQSFDVMDGAGAGDMRASVYDPNGTVATAGGIPAYALDRATFEDANHNIPLSKGGTGASTAADARTALGLGTAATKASTASVTSASTDLVESGGVYTAIESAKGTFTTAVSAAVGATSATISDASITTASVIDAYCDTTSGKPVVVKQITVTTGQAVLSFDALTEAASFKLWVR